MAFPTGIGTNSFLFCVLAGVRTGCPLSATLFLLATNPFVFLINMLSDGPGLSKSCFCADDVGSALNALKSLKTQCSIFRLAAKVSQMELKPSKCYIVVSVCSLSDNLKHIIQTWLAENVPEWKDFRIVSAAKYLGVFLGVDGANISYLAPTQKYFDRVEDISGASAPALGGILRYNERAVSVFSYVSQFVQIVDTKSMSALEQRGVHKMLRLPPNSMSRQFMHDLGMFSAKSPLALLPICTAALVRFAHSEEGALRDLLSEALDIIGDSISLNELHTGRVPDAGLACTPYINTLIDSLERRGVYSPLPAAVHDQAAIYRHLSAECVSSSPQLDLERKIRKTFADILGSVRTPGVSISHLYFELNWYTSLAQVLQSVKQQAAFSLLRTFVSGWTTSHRLHEVELLPCLFGCRDECDTVCHYILCSPLWQIAGAACGFEVPIDFSTRLCICKACAQHVQLLAVVCATYHYTKNWVKELGALSTVGQNSVQRIAEEASRTFSMHLT